MDSYLWILWIILGAVLIIAEVFTTGFVLLWFGIGALAAAFAGLIGIHSLVLQFLIFAGVSIGLTAASRTIFVNYFSRERSGGDLKTGVDALPGKVGTVVSSSKGALHEGAASDVRPGSVRLERILHWCERRLGSVPQLLGSCYRSWCNRR